MRCAQSAFPHVSLNGLSMRALAGVGPVLCVFPDSERNELNALRRASQICAECCIDDDGIRESLRLCDEAGSTCARLFLLPDSDYTAWERLREGLPCVASESRASACEKCVHFVRCLGRMLRGSGWKSSLLKIEPGRREQPCVSAVNISRIGREFACRIARAEGAPLPV